MNYDRIMLDEDESVYYKLGNELHRLDGPAIEHKDYKKWYVNGLEHREGGPAIVFTNGDLIWKQNGQYHREGGPAIESPNNPKENAWYKHGKLHRVDGPALLINGEEWYFNGKHHRDPSAGPAVKRGSIEQWMVHGKLHRLDGPAYKGENNEERYVDSKLHRLDSPAENNCTGNFWGWYKNGLRHRDVDPITGIAEGPTAYSQGSKFWYVSGQLHRIDGPAVEYNSGKKKWYINGVKLTEDEFNTHMNPKPDTPHNEVRITRNENGEETCREHLLYGKLHRVGAPAVEGIGKSEWWTLGVQQPNPNTKKCKVILDGVIHYADKVDIEFV